MIKRLIKLWPFHKLVIGQVPTTIYIWESNTEITGPTEIEIMDEGGWLDGERVRVVGIDEIGLPIFEVNPKYKRDVI